MDRKFRVLINSHYFYPSLGGLETVSQSLANGFIDQGVDCKVVTLSAANSIDDFAFEVIREPSVKQKIDLIKWADVILFNGASLQLQPWVLIYRKPFIWIHVGYQVSCIDGLGWVNGNKAPLTPFASFIYHGKLRGWGVSIKDGLKLGVKRFVAKNLVARNIAITHWVDQIQPLPNQVHIYNPFPIEQFLGSENKNIEYDFVFLGRIVSEKGVSTLLKAFAIITQDNTIAPKLLMIGDGEWKNKMIQLADELKISHLITFAGRKSGKELVEAVSKGSIAVVPSEWYEPMGGVALELMAAGKNVIVSEYGGLKECVGDAGLTFKNGDEAGLAACMLKLLNNKDLRDELLENSKLQIQKFKPQIFVEEYIKLLKNVAGFN